MANKKPNQVCSDCIHFHACQSWTSGILDDTDARPCRNYETPKQSSMYYLGRLDADKRNKPEPVIRKPWSAHGDGVFIDGEVDECPNCGNDEIEEGQIYCQVCGQALDWRDN